MGTTPFPSWAYYPPRDAAPAWVHDFVAVVVAMKGTLDSLVQEDVTSDGALAQLRPGLVDLGYRVEAGKRAADKISLPVLFGEQGEARVRYEVDAYHEDLGVLVEVEAGRATMGNAVYRDLIRTSLIVGARYLALGVPREYRRNGKIHSLSYRDTREQLDAIYASNRLSLPFEGVLLFGY